MAFTWKEIILFIASLFPQFDKAIYLDDKYLNAYFNKGLVLNILGRYYEAIDNFDKCISLNEKYSQAYLNKGISLDILNRRNEAIKEFDRIASIDEAIVRHLILNIEK